MNTLLFAVYRYLAMPIAVSILPIVAMFNGKMRTGLRLRRKKSEPLATNERPIWVHASSGEFEYAKAVIRQLKYEHPEIPIVVTYFSPTFSQAATNFPGVDRALALPLDLPGPCVSFLKKFQPRLGLIARTDLWPEILEQCRKRAVPVILFSYTQKSARGWLKRSLTKWVLHWVRQIYCVSSADLENLRVFASRQKAEVMGDTRYDQVAFRLQNPKPLPSGVQPKDDIPCFVAGSTWSEDEAVLLPALKPLLLKNKLRLILVPHEPTQTHITDLERQLKKSNLDFSLYSQANWNHEPVLLVDQVGVLAELYAFSDFAFVGGSFRKSVHSVMEALGAGCVTFVGPYHENNREALEFKSLSLLDAVATAEQMESRLNIYLDNPKQLQERKQETLAEFKRRLGASQRLVRGLETLL